jgi:hypothetical protein
VKNSRESRTSWVGKEGTNSFVYPSLLNIPPLNQSSDHEHLQQQ